MVACISPAAKNAQYTKSTLQYANKATKIKNKPKKNTDADDPYLAEMKAALAQMTKILEETQKRLEEEKKKVNEEKSAKLKMVFQLRAMQLSRSPAVRARSLERAIDPAILAAGDQLAPLAQDKDKDKDKDKDAKTVQTEAVKLQELEAEKTELKRQLDELKQAKEPDMGSRLKELEEENCELKRQLEELKQAKDQEVSVLTKQLETLQNENQTLSREVKRRGSKISKLNKIIEDKERGAKDDKADRSTCWSIFGSIAKPSRPAPVVARRISSAQALPASDQLEEEG